MSGFGLNLSFGSPSSSGTSRASNSGGMGSFIVSGANRFSGEYMNHVRGMMTRFNNDYLRRREVEETLTNKIEEIEKPPEVIPEDPLKVEILEFYAKNNAKEHHTEKYELVQDEKPTAIFRRGQPFFMALRLKGDRTFDFKTDTLKMIINFGPNGSVTKDTKIILPVTEDKTKFIDDKSKWDIRTHQRDGNTFSLQVRIPASAHVGIWKFVIETSLVKFHEKIEKHVVEEDVYILFNPYCKEDLVYMSNDTHRKEFVLNDTGKVWIGSHRQIKGRRWAYGQFDDVVLPAVMYLLEMSKLNHNERGNPVKVSRAISAIVNSLDDDGLLLGRWDGEYTDGTAPYAWTGSIAILEEYLKSGGQPVKYGQCWVFSAATVTVCRALGIPCRSVTNFISAHDTNHSLTVDKYFNAEGEEIVGGPDGECFDSLWNFHVWNDVWMARSDLPTGYGGWQVIDATPQEESESAMQCGPCSVEAVRRGEVGLMYDTPFVFSEVNADVCHFKEDKESDWGFTRVKINQYHVGRKIVSKDPEKDDDKGDSDLLDITAEYKDPEGSAEERSSVFNAVRGVEKAQQYYDYPKKGKEDVSFDLVEFDKVDFGSNFNIIINIENKSNEKRTVHASLSANSVYYTGLTGQVIKKSNGSFVLQPLQKEMLQVTVSPKEYFNKLVDYAQVKLYALCSVKETHQTWSEEDDFVLEKPKLEINIQGSAVVGKPCYINFSFKNPLKMYLTESKFSFEGHGVARPKIVKFRDVKSFESVSHTEVFYPRKAGESKIIGTFSSKQMIEVNGTTTIDVANK